MLIKVSEKNKELLDNYTSDELMGFIEEIPIDELYINEKLRNDYSDYEISDELYSKLLMISTQNKESINNVISRILLAKDIISIDDVDMYIKDKWYFLNKCLKE